MGDGQVSEGSSLDSQMTDWVTPKLVHCDDPQIKYYTGDEPYERSLCSVSLIDREKFKVMFGLVIYYLNVAGVLWRYMQVI